MDKEKKAIERIQTASNMSLSHYGKPLICTYSGGKDSDVMLELMNICIYFTREEIAKDAIKHVGEERIKKYLFGVYD